MKFFRTAPVWIPLFLSFVANGAELKSARVTHIINDVKLLPQQAAARAAIVNDNIGADTAVRTGVDSRTELTFSDLTITRLGANTIFSFNKGSRELSLGNGAVLVQVPRNGADVRISTAAVTAAVSGGTGLFEKNKGLPTKFLMLEGIGHFYPNGHPEDAVVIHGGEMVMMTPDGKITRPAKFNAAKLYKTSKLITSFPTLPNADLILAVIAEQQAEFAGGSSATRPDDFVDTRDQATTASVTSGGGGGSGKFGPPPLIVDDPYHITSGTAINTDPTITTNGITNLGKIYRSAALDGPLATWFGSSPIPFDSVEFFDSTSGGVFNDPDTVPIVGFRFNSLQLEGDPSVSNASGYPTLGLASDHDINSSPTGTVFTFGGMPQVGLVANGSINLSGISFANFEDLFIYARGGSVNMGASVSNINKVTLRAVDTVQVNAPINVSHSLKALGGSAVQMSSTVNANQITIQSLGSINIQNSSQLLAMVDSVGNSGQVVIIASGDNGAANISGTVQADQGEVDIRQTGTAGQTTLNNATIHGDVVKISALGPTGTLTIGTGNVLNADTILKLYAIGSNGRLNFISDVTLSSPSTILAADTINISQGVVVTINSTQPADVFTNHPNYFGFGGTGMPANSGTFAGMGAKNPQSLSAAPALGGPGQGP
jgi:hypothetical protein